MRAWYEKELIRGAKRLHEGNSTWYINYNQALETLLGMLFDDFKRYVMKCKAIRFVCSCFKEAGLRAAPKDYEKPLSSLVIQLCNSWGLILVNRSMWFTCSQFTFNCVAADKRKIYQKSPSWETPSLLNSTKVDLKPNWIKSRLHFHFFYCIVLFPWTCFVIEPRCNQFSMFAIVFLMFFFHFSCSCIGRVRILSSIFLRKLFVILFKLVIFIIIVMFNPLLM